MGPRRILLNVDRARLFGADVDTHRHRCGGADHTRGDGQEHSRSSQSAPVTRGVRWAFAARLMKARSKVTKRSTCGLDAT